VRERDSRALRLTAAGRRGLAETFGMCVPDDGPRPRAAPDAVASQRADAR
jgi:hypothetical protein